MPLAPIKSTPQTADLKNVTSNSSSSGQSKSDAVYFPRQILKNKKEDIAVQEVDEENNASIFSSERENQNNSKQINLTVPE